MYACMCLSCLSAVFWEITGLVSMYVCMYACMYACIHTQKRSNRSVRFIWVHTYVCMYHTDTVIPVRILLTLSSSSFLIKSIRHTLPRKKHEENTPCGKNAKLTRHLESWSTPSAAFSWLRSRQNWPSDPTAMSWMLRFPCACTKRLWLKSVCRDRGADSVCTAMSTVLFTHQRQSHSRVPSWFLLFGVLSHASFAWICLIIFHTIQHEIAHASKAIVPHRIPPPQIRHCLIPQVHHLIPVAMQDAPSIASTFPPRPNPWISGLKNRPGCGPDSRNRWPCWKWRNPTAWRQFLTRNSDHASRAFRRTKKKRDWSRLQASAVRELRRQERKAQVVNLPNGIKFLCICICLSYDSCITAALIRAQILVADTHHVHVHVHVILF